MSQRLISRSPDLKRLQDEGYELTVQSGFLVMQHVPYVTASREVRFGSLVSKLELADDVAINPIADHVAMFSGETPCDKDGEQLTKIINSPGRQELAEGLAVDFTLSSKPDGGYRDYHHKMTSYLNMFMSHAHTLDPNAVAATFPVITPDGDDDSVFKYIDTASSRAGIGLVTEKLKLGAIAVVGLGGTGSYILDLVAKTPVQEIHLWDGDIFIQHNAFRSPGAPSGEELGKRPLKADHFQRLYSNMRHNIVAHGFYIDESNVDQLKTMDFVFLALDRGAAKRLLVEKLEEFGVPFIEVGLGVLLDDDTTSLTGMVRTTTSTPEQRDHVEAKQRIPYSDGDANNEYSQNIQIADLNALSAALAVIKWKKRFGFYLDLEHEHFSLYLINGNHMINEDSP
jgi:hypothetical protein